MSAADRVGKDSAWWLWSAAALLAGAAVAVRLLDSQRYGLPLGLAFLAVAIAGNAVQTRVRRHRRRAGAPPQPDDRRDAG